WTTLHDGYFQEGAGGHTPTFAVKYSLNEQQFQSILSFIISYNYREYSLTANQCSTFVAQVANLADHHLDHQITFQIDPEIVLHGEKVPFWTDPYYSQLTISSPDILEKSLMQEVVDGNAEYALDWYLKRRPKPIKEYLKHTWETITLFPSRLDRMLL